MPMMCHSCHLFFYVDYLTIDVSRTEVPARMFRAVGMRIWLGTTAHYLCAVSCYGNKFAGVRSPTGTFDSELTIDNGNNHAKSNNQPSLWPIDKAEC